MIMPTMKTHGRVAALGALGVCAGCVALYALVIWIAVPTPTTGIDFEHALITMISVAVIIAALVAVHLVFARQLLAYTKGHGQKG
jgi:hypothetical protein